MHDFFVDTITGQIYYKGVKVGVLRHEHAYWVEDETIVDYGRLGLTDYLRHKNFKYNDWIGTHLLDRFGFW